MPKPPLSVDALTHDEASRRNAPTAELEPFVPAEVKRPILAAYERRNADLDPQLVWRGKDVADWSDLVVEAPPLYIQEKIHPKVLIDDLKRATPDKEADDAPDLFADFNGVDPEAATDFYNHEQHWSNRMILGDGLKVMASLAEREALKGKVQCIYIDPPYGIKFNSNFQWSTTSRDVKDGKADHLTREPEQVKAFRDTWRDGIHSYLTYLRDRLTVARDLLTESGSVFVQIGEENVHRVRALLDEIFGEANSVSQITFFKSGSQTTTLLPSSADYILWYAKDISRAKMRPAWYPKIEGKSAVQVYRHVLLPDGTRRNLTSEEFDNPSSLPVGSKIYRLSGMTSATGSSTTSFAYTLHGKTSKPPRGGWRTNLEGMDRLTRADMITPSGTTIATYKYIDDFPLSPHTNIWMDTGTGSFTDPKIYVVQTGSKTVERCILMTTDPGDLVLDPTCGSGTTAYVAEQWGRRWITIDTSRVALALARARLMGARYPWYLLADSPEGQKKEAEVTRLPPATSPTQNRLRQGFVYKRVPHITLKSIANNAEIDTIWEKYLPFFEWIRPFFPGEVKEEWEVFQDGFAEKHGNPLLQVEPNCVAHIVGELRCTPPKWEREGYMHHNELIALARHIRIARQKEIDASIAARADTEYLYDQPYEDKGRVRVAGPFTVESLSPHRVPAVDVDDSLFDELEAAEGRRQPDAVGGGEAADFVQMVLDNLKKSGVQQAHKADRVTFASLTPWPGRFVAAEGRVRQSSDPEDAPEKRAAIFIGPEYGTVSRPDLVGAAKEAMEAGFDLLIAAAFNFDAHASEFEGMGALTALQARINPDLHMPDLANTGAGNLFTVFGEPDIAVHDEGDGRISIEVAGIDMYKGGEIVSNDPDEIAVWFIDTDYNYESFFVRHAYFPGANDPYKALKTTLKAEIDTEAWESLKKTRSRPFPRPTGGRVAVKVINHLGDEVMKVVEV
ncbi:site-specific DNA-methyltransferase [Novosphingobium sp. PC22D]|uniref:site-specific DNA-methyltransferase n=1 Tax=Novosphingobium sp. PC22D TaxID=1962403 RepID=UPI000BF052D8|nr:site-specific DNA-methyltransferase [Novosphingobium sp. PC22D]PEQ10297.1 site-specific DNA-methyltransferase [Novosphingobium sp. PC22D]